MVRSHLARRLGVALLIAGASVLLWAAPVINATPVQAAASATRADTCVPLAKAGEGCVCTPFVKAGQDVTPCCVLPDVAAPQVNDCLPTPSPTVTPDPTATPTPPVTSPLPMLPTPTPSSGVGGVITHATPNSGVLGITTPPTGAVEPSAPQPVLIGLGLALMGAGLLLARASSRRRSAAKI